LTELERALHEADDDYLVAMSNKGVFKRACADLEKLQPSIVSSSETELRVRVGEEECTISLPLTASSCSCPSASICRHIVVAILFARSRLAPAEDSDYRPENDTKSPSILDVLRTQSVSALKRAAGSSRITLMAKAERQGQRPRVENGSVITVHLDAQRAVVRMMDTVESSVCSCHSLSLCSHKAEAALWLMLREGIVTLEQLEGRQEGASLLTEEMLSAASQVAAAVCGWISSGLCRLDDSAGQQAEQLAITCHNAQLAVFERRCRVIGSMLRDYNSRSSMLRSEEIMEAVFSLWHDASTLPGLPADRAEAVIGEFREVYYPVGDLDLALVSERAFSGRGGYEGTVYYFFELSQRRWYTLVSARPTFYDTQKRRRDEHLQVWNLDYELSRLYGKRFTLTGAKAAGEKLSSTGKASAVVTGDFTVAANSFADVIIYDFGRLADMLDGDFEDTPVIIAPAEAVSAEDDTVNHRFCLTVRDRKGTSLGISLRYSAKDEHIIRMLRRQYKSRDKQPLSALFGTLYIYNGRLMLYPIDIIPEGERKSDGC